MLIRLLTILLFFALKSMGQAKPTFIVRNIGSASPGYYFLTVQKPVAVSTSTIEPYYNMILDHLGQVVYYKRFEGDQKVCDFKVQANGLISFFQKNKFYLMDSTFTIVDSVYCKNGLQTDSHELLMKPDGNKVLIGIATHTADLSSYHYFNHRAVPGNTQAIVLSGVIQEQNQKAEVVFEWYSKDHFQFNEVDTMYLSDANKVDWTHINALELDRDGNFLISVRNFNEVTKIDRATGEVLWRLGGKKNDFNINDNIKFVGQHDVRRLANNDLSLFDNGAHTRVLHPAAAKVFRIDEKLKTVRLIWKYEDRQDAHSNKGLGNVQHLSNGDILINYGNSNISPILFNILTKNKQKSLELSSADTLRSYRVYFYEKLPNGLKRPQITETLSDGKITLEVSGVHSNYRWNNGATTKKIEVKGSGKYTVWVPAGNGGSISSKTHTVKIDPAKK